MKTLSGILGLLLMCSPMMATAEKLSMQTQSVWTLSVHDPTSTHALNLMLGHLRSPIRLMSTTSIGRSIDLNFLSLTSKKGATRTSIQKYDSNWRIGGSICCKGYDLGFRYTNIDLTQKKRTDKF